MFVKNALYRFALRPTPFALLTPSAINIIVPVAGNPMVPLRAWQSGKWETGLNLYKGTLLIYMKVTSADSEVPLMAEVAMNLELERKGGNKEIVESFIYDIGDASEFRFELNFVMVDSSSRKILEVVDYEMSPRQTLFVQESLKYQLHKSVPQFDPAELGSIHEAFDKCLIKETKNERN